jgi:hypothetical protein
VTPRTLTFTIPGRLPGLNEVIRVGRGNRYGGARQKQVTEALITPYVPRPITTLRSPVTVTVVWHEKDARRDPDNVTAGTKFILDTLVALGVLLGDGRKHIASITHRVTTDKSDPRVVVCVEEVVAPCPACDGDGRIPDKTGGGHHGVCKTCAGTGARA